MKVTASPLIERLKHSGFAILISLDILLCTIWQAVLYPLGLASKPSGRRMISSFVGEAAHNRHRWGIALAAILDRVFLWMGDRPDHCGRAFINYQNMDD